MCRIKSTFVPVFILMACFARPDYAFGQSFEMPYQAQGRFFLGVEQGDVLLAGMRLGNRYLISARHSAYPDRFEDQIADLRLSADLMPEGAWLRLSPVVGGVSDYGLERSKLFAGLLYRASWSKVYLAGSFYADYELSEDAVNGILDAGLGLYIHESGSVYASYGSRYVLGNRNAYFELGYNGGTEHLKGRFALQLPSSFNPKLLRVLTSVIIDWGK